MSRRKFSKEFKEAAVRRLELGASVTEVARAVEVIPNMLHRWRQELRNHRVGAFSGYGKSRAPIEPRTQAVIFRLTEDELNQSKESLLRGRLAKHIRICAFSGTTGDWCRAKVKSS